MFSAIRRFGAHRAFTRQQLAAIHAKRGEAHGRLHGEVKLDSKGNIATGYRRAWQMLSEQKPTSNATRNFLNQRREHLANRIERTSNELDRLDAEHSAVRRRQFRNAAITGALAALPAAAILGLKTNAGRRMLAKGLLRFKPLAPIEAVLETGKGEIHQALIRNTLAAEGKLKGKASKGVERLFDKVAGEMPRQGKSIEAIPLSSVTPDQILKHGLEEFRSEGGGRPGVIDRAQAKFYDSVIHPTLSHPYSDKVATEKFGKGTTRRFIYDHVQRPIANQARLSLIEEAHTPDQSPLMLRRRARAFAESAEQDILGHGGKGGYKGSRYAEKKLESGNVRRRGPQTRFDRALPEEFGKSNLTGYRPKRGEYNPPAFGPNAPRERAATVKSAQEMIYGPEKSTALKLTEKERAIAKDLADPAISDMRTISKKHDISPFALATLERRLKKAKAIR